VDEDGLPTGAEFASGLRLKEAVPKAHKVGLKDIAAGEVVVRYGTTIGFAHPDLAAGSWVREGVSYGSLRIERDVIARGIFHLSLRSGSQTAPLHQCLRPNPSGGSTPIQPAASLVNEVIATGH